MRNRRHNYADGCRLDTGDMLYKLVRPITAEDTSGSLYIVG